uniref:dual specificity tyrosine-phosphorylation-regulated kinase mbk-2 isoform X1 n=1 Tax=Anopheles coluzzii TaxID=1518534 RepID=UPI0020FF9399|nr:dual specificity tyrosine-phosphorylation-regulated kinase mbk-2 isoform X1 [Anopheles coluzzii]XP_040223785.2 dual specificity tyrosine-phosphorylation-regulated kinase mbk-2 isoform X1 [Anopheles coluzzii]
MASRVPLTYEMSPTVHTEADIESAVAVAKQVAEAVEEEEGSADDLHPRLPGTTTTAFQPSPVVVVPGSVTIVVECHNDADAAADGGTDGSRITTTTNNNSASMKCLNFTTSPHASARNTHPASGQGCISNTTVQDGGFETTTSSPSPPLSPPIATTTTTVDSAKSNQFVNHSFSCGRGEEDMGTSGSVVVASEDCAEAAQTQPGMTELARGFADVVRVSTSVPQPVTVSCCATGPGGNGVAPRGTPTAGTSFHYATAAAVAAVAMTAAAAAAAATTAAATVSPSRAKNPVTPCASGDGDDNPLPPPLPPPSIEPMAPTPAHHPVHYHPMITISDHNVDATANPNNRTTTTITTTTNPTVHELRREVSAGPSTQSCDNDHHHHHHHQQQQNYHHSNPTVVMPFVPPTNVPLDADRCDELTANVPSSTSNYHHHHQYHHPVVTTTTTTSTTSVATNTVTGRTSKPPLHSYQHHYQSYHHHQLSTDSCGSSSSGGGVPPAVSMVAGGGTYRSHSARFMTQHIKILPKTQSLDLADNDDMLEASNRSESQLEISAAGIGPGAGGLRGRVLPKLQTLEQTTRPIYPNVPYSPYNSPYGSPRSGRRRTPLRESRRVSIEQSGSFLQLNQYKLLDQIGQGSYGLVKLAYSEEDSTHYAMKILSKRKLLRKAGLMRRGPKRGTSPLDRVYREIAVLKKLDHPNVVKLVEVLDDPLEDSLYLVFELVQQGEVLSIPTETPLSEERAWNVFRDVLLGVEYLHYQRIIHGDLKPANLLLSDSGSVKVADLGVCNEFLGEDAAMNNGSTAGTPAFRAPETLLPGQHFYNGKAADIWALGATLFSLVHGNVPFIATSVPGVYEKIKNDPLEFPANCSSAAASTISEELRDLISRMLDKDPQQRITLPQIKEHPWMTKHGTVRLPSEEENCRLVQISDEDMSSVVKSIPKLDTLILIKTMLKKHSFQNPFTKGISGRAPQAGGSRLERFCRSGRSNSAPGDYHTSERQPSSESLLPSVTEGVTSPLGSPDATSTVATITTGSIISELDSLTLRSDVSCPSSSTDNDTATSLLSTSYYEVLL